jgi:metallo-beta-lactamase class B
MEQAMFGRSLLLAAIVLSACAPMDAKPRVAKTFEPINQACAGRDGWSDAAPPAHVFANVYMVGTCGITVLLITTTKGHFLIDGATKEAAQGIVDNIRKLGFNPKDVRYLLATHEHLDHVGGLAELQRLTGAKFVTRAAAQAAMESGKPDLTDPQSGAIPDFEGIKADRVRNEGDAVWLGKQYIYFVETPGHTPGGTSYAWYGCEGKMCLWLTYADSLNAVSAEAYRFTDHPEYVATLRKSMTRIETISTCDILITPHPGQSNFFERLAGAAPLVDKDACKRYVAAARNRLDVRLVNESAPKEAPANKAAN